MKVWQCSVCKYVHKGEEPPEKCPVCGVDASKFVEIDDASIPEKKTKKQAPVSTGLDVKPDEPAVQDQTFREKVESLLVKHHAHPVSVHTPNGVLPMSAILYVLAWLFNSELLAKTAMISQVFVMLSLPVVIYTGRLEWRKKYAAAMTPVFKLKILAASLTTATCFISLIWYVADPGMLNTSRAWVFILINVLMLASAGVAGHIGGKLVFKD